MSQSIPPITKVPGSTLGGLTAGVASEAIPGLFPRSVAQLVPPGINAGAAITGIAQAARNPMGFMTLAGQAVHGALAARAARRASASARAAVPGAQLLLAPAGSFTPAPSRYRALAVVTGTTTATDGTVLTVDIPYQAQVTVKEDHRDDLVITDHPVEYGAAITDHAFKRPAELSLVVGWSNSPGPRTSGKVGTPSVSSPLVPWSRTGDFIRNVYSALLKLQLSRTPFTVYTGKRVYSNMLFASLHTETVGDTENALIVTAHLREIIIATVQVTNIPRNAVQDKQGGGTGPVSGTSTVANTGRQVPSAGTNTINTAAVCRAVGTTVDLVNAPITPLSEFQ